MQYNFRKAIEQNSVKFASTAQGEKVLKSVITALKGSYFPNYLNCVSLNLYVSFEDSEECQIYVAINTRDPDNNPIIHWERFYDGDLETFNSMKEILQKEYEVKENPYFDAFSVKI